MRRLSLLSALLLLLLAACRQQQEKAIVTTADAVPQEDTLAKTQLQGTWMDNVTGEVMLKAEGDTIYYADATNLPTYFRIVGDSIELGNDVYQITKQTPHNFWFLNHAGDEIQLVKRDSADADQPDFVSQEPKVISTTEVVKIDSVVMYGGQRYHWYIAINPTRYRVLRTTYTPEGVAVQNVYYDNIIHVSVFKGNRRLFGRNFNKQAYAADVPQEFLDQSILGNIRYSHTDSQGFHFNATICIPDGDSCYLVETLISFDGQLSLKLLEY
jgi:hypothetical protein